MIGRRGAGSSWTHREHSRPILTSVVDHEHRGDVVGIEARHQRRNRAWLLLAGMLIGLCTWGGTASADPGPTATFGTGCASDGTADEVTLPSGATASVCEDPSVDPPAATSADGLSIVLSKTVGRRLPICSW